MQQAGNRPEPALYASLVQCLWDSAVPAAQAQAGKLFVVGCRSGAVLPPLQQNNKEDRTLEVMSRLLPCNIARLVWVLAPVTQVHCGRIREGPQPQGCGLLILLLHSIGRMALSACLIQQNNGEDLVEGPHLLQISATPPTLELHEKTL